MQNIFAETLLDEKDKFLKTFSAERDIVKYDSLKSLLFNTYISWIYCETSVLNLLIGCLFHKFIDLVWFAIPVYLRSMVSNAKIVEHKAPNGHSGDSNSDLKSDASSLEVSLTFST